jgi:hypothetical protein
VSPSQPRVGPGRYSHVLLLLPASVLVVLVELSIDSTQRPDSVLHLLSLLLCAAALLILDPLNKVVDHRWP